MNQKRMRLREGHVAAQSCCRSQVAHSPDPASKCALPRCISRAHHPDLGAVERIVLDRVPRTECYFLYFCFVSACYIRHSATDSCTSKFDSQRVCTLGFKIRILFRYKCYETNKYSSCRQMHFSVFFSIIFFVYTDSTRCTTMAVAAPPPLQMAATPYSPGLSW